MLNQRIPARSAAQTTVEIAAVPIDLSKTCDDVIEITKLKVHQDGTVTDVSNSERQEDLDYGVSRAPDGTWVVKWVKCSLTNENENTKTRKSGNEGRSSGVDYRLGHSWEETWLQSDGCVEVRKTVRRHPLVAPEEMLNAAPTAQDIAAYKNVNHRVDFSMEIETWRELQIITGDGCITKNRSGEREDGSKWRERLTTQGGEVVVKYEEDRYGDVMKGNLMRRIKVDEARNVSLRVDNEETFADLCGLDSDCSVICEERWDNEAERFSTLTVSTTSGELIEALRTGIYSDGSRWYEEETPTCKLKRVQQRLEGPKSQLNVTTLREEGPVIERIELTPLVDVDIDVDLLPTEMRMQDGRVLRKYCRETVVHDGPVIRGSSELHVLRGREITSSTKQWTEDANSTSDIIVTLDDEGSKVIKERRTTKMWSGSGGKAQEQEDVVSPEGDRSVVYRLDEHWTTESSGNAFGEKTWRMEDNGCDKTESWYCNPEQERQSDVIVTFDDGSRVGSKSGSRPNLQGLTDGEVIVWTEEWRERDDDRFYDKFWKIYKDGKHEAVSSWGEKEVKDGSTEVTEHWNELIEIGQHDEQIRRRWLRRDTGDAYGSTTEEEGDTTRLRDSARLAWWNNQRGKHGEETWAYNRGFDTEGQWEEKWNERDGLKTASKSGSDVRNNRWTETWGEENKGGTTRKWAVKEASNVGASWCEEWREEFTQDGCKKFASKEASSLERKWKETWGEETCGAGYGREVRKWCDKFTDEDGALLGEKWDDTWMADGSRHHEYETYDWGGAQDSRKETWNDSPK